MQIYVLMLSIYTAQICSNLVEIETTVLKYKQRRIGSVRTGGHVSVSVTLFWSVEMAVDGTTGTRAADENELPAATLSNTELILYLWSVLDIPI